ncbi:hypothetical protein ACF05L_16585 [Streptomyces bobili]|uniref:hypothetical protein n=1 Tax=Streptomyces bobili TaxID=67280 RepID=UPI0036F586DE
MDLDLNERVAVISIAIPSLGFLGEFAVVGRKRLGCRVQMDTLAEHATQSPYAGVLRDMRLNGHRLKDPSFVLLRIENAGSALIDDIDYLTPSDAPCGIRVTVRRRHVAGLVVTELSHTGRPSWPTPTANPRPAPSPPRSSPTSPNRAAETSCAPTATDSARRWRTPACASRRERRDGATLR